MRGSADPVDLIVALDVPRCERALEIVDELGDLPLIFKVGLELFVSEGPGIVRELVHRKKRVCLDLKFHDIPNAVARATRQAALLHVEMFTVHLAGGSQMVRAVANELSEISLLKPRVLGVSVLSSFDDVRWAEVTRAMTGHAVDASDSADGLVEHAVSWGADGVVCSAFELPSLRSRFPALYAAVSGIRPETMPAHDHAEILTPRQARQAGASAVIIGRPIVESPDPRAVVHGILEELRAPPSFESEPLLR